MPPGTMALTPGPKNLITDVAGLQVGNAHDEQRATGVTVILSDGKPFTAAVDIRGGGPATRDTDPLALTSTVEECHAVVLSGGSGHGLGAADAVQAHLKARGIGLPVADQIVPIVPQAILFDLANGGDKNWGQTSPYPDYARRAVEAAATDFKIGSTGAGYGATTADLRGGLGSASIIDADLQVGAIAAVNAVGSVLIPGSEQFWAAPHEMNGEFGNRGLPVRSTSQVLPPTKLTRLQASTTICAVSTNATLSKVQCHRLAVMAQTGLTHAIRPAHTPFDGDLVFALSTGSGTPLSDPADLMHLGQLAAITLARAIARGVYEAATPPAHMTTPPAYRDRFPN